MQEAVSTATEEPTVAASIRVQRNLSNSERSVNGGARGQASVP